MPLRNLFILIGCLLAGVATWAARHRDLPGSRINEVLAIISRSALEPVAARQLFEAAIQGVVGQLDEHSAYIPRAEQNGFEALLDQQFGGVGLELVQDEATGELVVSSPVVSGPAWQAGIVAGDRIIAIDGQPTQGVPLARIVGLLRGPIGTPVTLRIAAARGTHDPTVREETDTATRDARLERALVTTETVLGDRRRPDGTWSFRIEDEPDVGLLRITGFGERTAGEIDAALASLATEPSLRGIVLDLRGNPGGLLSAAVSVCDRFLQSGVIVATRGRRERAEQPPLDPREATAGEMYAGVPMVVLIDGLTASAAEIVAACLQDHGRAAIVGSRTFGKGTVQSVVPLGGGDGLLKLTTAEYVRPRGAAIHRRPDDRDDATWGVVPDRGAEIAPPAASLERLRRWRRQRDAVAVPGHPASSAASMASRSMDEVLAVALDAIACASVAPTQLGGEKETASDADETVAAGE
ncbi:MAG: S41 family peptidase [Planctomycetaceae bacterium]